MPILLLASYARTCVDLVGGLVHGEVVGSLSREDVLVDSDAALVFHTFVSPIGGSGSSGGRSGW